MINVTPLHLKDWKAYSECRRIEGKLLSTDYLRYLFQCEEVSDSFVMIFKTAQPRG